MKMFFVFSIRAALFVAALTMTAATIEAGGGGDAQTILKQLKYEKNNQGGITITGYTGGAATVVIPKKIERLPVTAIGKKAFEKCASLTSVTLSRKTRVGYDRFPKGARLTYSD